MHTRTRTLWKGKEPRAGRGCGEKKMRADGGGRGGLCLRAIKVEQGGEEGGAGRAGNEAIFVLTQP